MPNGFLIVLVFIAGLIGGLRGLLPAFNDEQQPSLAPAATYDFEPGDQNQLLAIFFGSDSCFWCNHEELPELIRRAFGGLEEAAGEAGLKFVSMGVALDWSPQTGISFLQRIGTFDQVSAGYSWGNAAAVDFRGMPAIVGTPQIVVLRRTLHGAGVEGATALTATETRVVARRTGLHEIKEWVERGVPVSDALQRTMGQ